MPTGFDSLTRHLPTPLVLLSADGRVLDANPVALELLGCARLQPGRLFEELIQPVGEFGAYLDMCARSLSPLPGRFGICNREQRSAYLCKAWRLPGSEQPRILLRFWKREEKDAFLLLGQKVEELNNEIRRRKLVESELRSLAETLEEQVESRTRELQQTEEALRQSQKMEAVGQLTGGIAHDFNNLILGITGSLGLAMRRLKDGRSDEISRFIELAMNSANRAAALTHRLLAFSRRQPLAPRPVRVAQLVASMEELLRRTIGEKIELELDCSRPLGPALCDPNQLENAILNLAINSRDAMPEGGKLKIGIDDARLDEQEARRHEVTPGEYIRLRVSDTGTGMPADVIARACEPFYTTKPLGQGTGLGLSMIYGFIRQSGGWLEIDSELGKGTIIGLYLRRTVNVLDEAGLPAATAAAAKSSADGVILVVEDEVTVRNLIVEVLQELGYAILQAPDGASGLRILRSEARVDLLVTDVGLPALNGRQMADTARETRRDLKVLFMTGYAENSVMGDSLPAGMELIAKPFSMNDMASRVGRMIAQTSPVTAGTPGN